MGARHMNEIRRWIGPTVSITLQQYGSNLTEGFASFTPTSMAMEMADQIEDTAKGASDLLTRPPSVLPLRRPPSAPARCG